MHNDGGSATGFSARRARSLQRLARIRMRRAGVGRCGSLPWQAHREVVMISFETAKGLEFFMIFGALFAFGFWQLREVNKLAREREQKRASLAANADMDEDNPRA
jgi:hypothetical protein